MKTTVLLTSGCVMVSMLLAQTGCGEAPKSDLQKDMVRLDQVYIPALALTSQRKVVPAQKTMSLLNARWKAFKETHSNPQASDAQWPADFDRIDRLIAKAESIVTTGQNLMQAHETLEGVRTTLLKLRRRNGIDYFVDYLTDFHGPMEAIVLSAKGKTEADLTQAEVEKIRTLLSQATALWHELTAAHFDTTLFEFDAPRLKKMRQYQEAETSALARLQQALNNGNNSATLSAAIALKPNFAKLFMLFGDFKKT